MIGKIIPTFEVYLVERGTDRVGRTVADASATWLKFVVDTAGERELLAEMTIRLNGPAERTGALNAIGTFRTSLGIEFISIINHCNN